MENIVHWNWPNFITIGLMSTAFAVALAVVSGFVFHGAKPGAKKPAPKGVTGPPHYGGTAPFAADISGVG